MKRQQPPTWIDKILHYRLPKEQFEEVQGDMHELYHHWAEEMGKRKANRMYLLNAFTFLRPLPKRSDSLSCKIHPYLQTNSLDMIRSYLVIAFRYLLKRRLYAGINIFGLSIGITFTLLISSYIWSEVQVNATLKNAPRHYIVQSKWTQKDMGLEITTLAPLGKTLKEEYPHLVANYYRFDGITSIVSKGDKHFREDIQVGDSTLLDMYGFSLIHGNAQTALNSPNSVVITAQKALKYFGKTDVIGQTLTISSNTGDKQDFAITGILDKLPRNSVTNLLNIDNQIFTSTESMSFFGRGDMKGWDNIYIVTYIELKEGVKPSDLEQPLAQILARHAPETIKANLHSYLTPLQDFYLETNNALVNKLIVTLAWVVTFILLMAIVNFVNISIGSSSSRLKEIGVRKVLGGIRRQLVYQFLTESIVLAFIAMLLSLVLYEVFRPFFGDLLGQQITSLFSVSPYLFGIPVGLALLIGSLAGIYPAFVLSSMPSVDSLKGKLKSVKENIIFRRLLIASQFSVALIVFFGALIISRQVDLFFTKELGYNKETIFSVALPRDFSPKGVAKMETVRNEFMRLPVIESASFSYEIPDGNNGFSANLYLAEKDSTQSITAKVLQTDEKYAETYRIKMAEGQFFHAQQGTYNPERIVLNEAAVQSLGFKNPQQAIGQKIKVQGTSFVSTIFGVTKNFHFESMHSPVRPIVFTHVRNTRQYRFLSLKLKPGNISQSIASVEGVFHQLLPGAPFEFTFMDDTLQKLYQSEIQLKKAAQIATVLALVIVWLGVMGMVSLSITRRMKELGIRKVLGASVRSLVLLFIKEFMLVWVLAVGIAFPLAYFIMHNWLQAYAYRIEMGWISFVSLGAAFALFISFIISLQTIRAARTNPSKILRSE
ncbi:ABC transporter permease [Rhodocytophaga aerolata]|uniref:ABC transporter permease n=1 Tax=Rhodocytophaga aerolata TaxID=455078 RepID=A0ABT8RIE6_9BACT|nr:ABC transporter permease [Rhodocytophaga aerolata]MDO1451134.1 ABC transporter permease [Rhodocytophaga aerolata]